MTKVPIGTKGARSIEAHFTCTIDKPPYPMVAVHQHRFVTWDECIRELRRFGRTLVSASVRSSDILGVDPIEPELWQRLATGQVKVEGKFHCVVIRREDDGIVRWSAA